MKNTIRSLLILIAAAVLLVACGTSATPSASADPSPSAPATPSEAPSDEPTETPDGAPVPSGTLTAVDGAVVDGPGIPLAEALEGDLSQPLLVRGTLFLDEDGTVWMADSITDASVPIFGDIRVRVANYPTDGPTWDMADAEITGLQEVNGIRFYEDTKLYGTITP
ncbi:MAG TPA: hypothetical protein VF365_06440 [Candidatus Limnocylindria bacterium]